MAYHTRLLYLFAVICILFDLAVPTPYNGILADPASNRVKPRIVPMAHPESGEHAVARPVMVPHMDPHHAAHLTPAMSKC